MKCTKISPPSKVGFIGLGSIGLPIASNILKAGYSLKVHNRNRIVEQDISIKDAERCKSPADAASGCRSIILCLSDHSAVDMVLFGDMGAISSLEPGSIVIDCSTISPNKSKEFSQRLIKHEVSYIDAPVTGGTEGAAAGELTIFAGGDKKKIELVKEILESFSKNLYHFGKVGKGQEVKAINQILVAGCYASVAEAISLGAKLDLPMDMVIDALQTGAGSSWALNHRAHSMLQNSYPLGFKVELHNKDLGIALESASQVALNLPLTEMIKSIEEDLIKLGFKNDDISALHRWLNLKRTK